VPSAHLRRVPLSHFCPHSQGRRSSASSIPPPPVLEIESGSWLPFGPCVVSDLGRSPRRGSFSQFLVGFGFFFSPFAALLERYSTSARTMLFPRRGACFDVFVLSWTATVAGSVDLEGLHLSSLEEKMAGAALVAIAASIGNLLQGWDNATIAGKSSGFSVSVSLHIPRVLVL
jgi:hypothetical protein